MLTIGHNRWASYNNADISVYMIMVVVVLYLSLISAITYNETRKDYKKNNVIQYRIRNDCKHLNSGYNRHVIRLHSAYSKNKSFFIKLSISYAVPSTHLDYTQTSGVLNVMTTNTRGEKGNTLNIIIAGLLINVKVQDLQS